MRKRLAQGSAEGNREVGSLIAFLASPSAASVNGANYRIDGGQVQAVN